VNDLGSRSDTDVVRAALPDGLQVIYGEKPRDKFVACGPLCDRTADVALNWGGIGGEEIYCPRHGLETLALAVGDEPPFAVAALDGAYVHTNRWACTDFAMALRGDETGDCVCGWTGNLREMWVERHTLVCPACHEGGPRPAPLPTRLRRRFFGSP
jgi:hypothetical protein